MLEAKKDPRDTPRMREKALKRDVQEFKHRGGLRAIVKRRKPA